MVPTVVQGRGTGSMIIISLVIDDSYYGTGMLLTRHYRSLAVNLDAQMFIFVAGIIVYGWVIARRVGQD